MAGVEPVAAWEPERDVSSVSEAVAAFRTALAENAAETGREWRGPQLTRLASELVRFFPVIAALLGLLFLAIRACHGSLVR